MNDSPTSALPADSLVLGCWPLGGAARNLGTAMGWDDLTDEAAIEVVHSALSVGIVRFDTADAYGLGRSERRLGLALEGVPRASVSISSKVGYLQPSDGSSLWTADNLGRALEGSLERLNTDYLDTWYVHHNSLDALEIGRLVDTLLRFRSQGLVRRVGIRGPHRFSPERSGPQRSDKRAQYTRMLEAVKPDVVSLRSNLLTPPDGTAEVYDWAKAAGASVQTYKTLGQGLLTPAYSKGFPGFGPGDHRSKKPWFAQQAHPALTRLRDEIMAAVPGHSLMDVAFAWVLTHCPATDLVVGSRTAAHVRQWVDARLPVLSTESLNLIQTAVDRYRTEVPGYLE